MGRNHNEHRATAPAPGEEGGAMLALPTRFPSDGCGIEPAWWKRFHCLKLVMEHGSDADRREPLSQAKALHDALESVAFGAHNATAPEASDNAEGGIAKPG